MCSTNAFLTGGSGYEAVAKRFHILGRVQFPVVGGLGSSVLHYRSGTNLYSYSQSVHVLML